MPTPNPIIRAWRKYRGLSAEGLAKRAGYHRSFIYKVEDGRKQYNQDFLERVSLALDCSPADLIGNPPGARQVIHDLTEEELELLARFLHRVRSGGAPPESSS